MKRELPPYVRKRINPRGKVYWYFERNGKRIPLPEPRHPDFWAAYARAGRDLPQTPSVRNWRALVTAYRASERYTKLADRTKADYENALRFLSEKWGDLDPAKLKRSQVIAVMRQNAQNTRKANDFKVVVSRCLEEAKDMDWLRGNVAKDIPHLKPSTRLNRQPWPQDLIEAFRKEAPIGTRARLIFELCLGTGQRIGDVLEMRRSFIKDDELHITQSKTGKRLCIPIPAALRSVLAGSANGGLYLAHGRHGRSLSYRQAQDAVMKVRQRIGAEAYDIHGLRHSAAKELYEAGCTDEEVKAITGHSAVTMLRLYGGQARQKRHARAAQEKRK